MCIWEGLKLKNSMLVFGFKEKTHLKSEFFSLKSSCPVCNSDLRYAALKQWFSVFLVAIVPLFTLRNLYLCENCKNTFLEEKKDSLLHKNYIAPTQEELAKTERKSARKKDRIFVMSLSFLLVAFVVLVYVSSL